MRECEFRGKSLKTGRWLFGDLIHNRGKVYIAPVGEFYFDGTGETDFEISPETVGQFTGQYDKYGRPIYEGDIMEGISGGDNFVIEWDGNASGFYRRIPDDGIDAGDPRLNSFNSGQSGIIGNIHDNPGLLEE